MINLIDNIFSPFLLWLNTISSYLTNLSVPLSRPINLSKYFSIFSFLGPAWTTVITTAISLVVIYLILMVVIKNIDLLLKFWNFVKFW